MPSSKAASSSAGATDTLFNVPRTSVNHSRTKRMSRSSSVRRTNSCCRSMIGSLPFADVTVRVFATSVSGTLLDHPLTDDSLPSRHFPGQRGTSIIVAHPDLTPWGGVPVEFQPAAIRSAPLTNGTARPATGEWPAVPPAPTPVKPPATTVTPAPPPIRAGVVRMVRPGSPSATDDSPTVTIPAPSPESPPALLEPTRESQVYGQVRHQPRTGDEELIWQSTFAYV